MTSTEELYKTLELIRQERQTDLEQYKQKVMLLARVGLLDQHVLGCISSQPSRQSQKSQCRQWAEDKG